MPVALLFTTVLVSAGDLPFVGNASSSCVPAPNGSMRFKSQINADGTETNNVAVYEALNCTGAMIESPATIYTYSVLVRGGTRKFIVQTTVVDPSTVSEGQPYVFKSEYTLLSGGRLRVKYLNAVLKSAGVPLIAPAEVLRGMSSLEWSLVGNP